MSISTPAQVWRYWTAGFSRLPVHLLPGASLVVPLFRMTGAFPLFRPHECLSAHFLLNAHNLSMKLGWLDVCLRVADVGVSRGFYEGLGFRRVEGDDAEGWAVMVHDESRIGLYELAHMGEDEFCLNFRGGNVAEVATSLVERGIPFLDELKVSPEGGASARLKDPDGHVIFLDAAAGETKKV